MDEKVERPVEDITASRQVASGPQPVTSEVFLPSGLGIAYESTFIPSNRRPLIFGKPHGGMSVANYSLQTGEEFALQFAQEASRTHRGPEFEQVLLPKVNVHEANPYVYEDLTGILNIERVDSGINSEISMLTVDKGNLAGYGNHCNPAPTDSLQGIQISHSGNDAGYQLDDGLSTRSAPQTRLQHMSYSSTHRPYLSAPSNESSPGRVKFMCSFGGKILPRPGDGKLRYVGGETRIITVYKDIGYEELMRKIMDVYGQDLVLKYQLPGEDLDALVSVSSDEDLENMMEEYDKLESNDGPSRLRVFLFTAADSDLTHFDVMADRRYSEQQYVDAVNGIPEMSSRKNSGTIGSFSLQHLDNLIGLDVAENWNGTRRAQEGLDSLRPQFSIDGTKIVNFPSVVPCYSKPAVPSATFAIKPPTISAPFSSLPMHIKQSVVADNTVHFMPGQINKRPYSVARAPEGYHDIDYGRTVSSAAFQHELQYRHTESRTSLDSPTNLHSDFLPPSHSDSMYKSDGWFTDTMVIQPISSIRSDGLHPVDLQRFPQVAPRVHQPVWPHHFDGEQFNYTPTDCVPQVKSGGMPLQQPVQQHTIQNSHLNVLPTANLDTAVSKQADRVHVLHGDTLESPQGSILSNERGENALKHVGSSPSSPCQGGGGQLHAHMQQTHNAPNVDEQHSGTRVPHENNQFNGVFHRSASPDYSEQLHEQPVYQQSLPFDKSLKEEQFSHQQTISREQVANLDERFFHPQALPHVLSDTVLQTHITKSVHPTGEGIPVSQGHHSDSLLGTKPPYGGSRTSQERLISFQDDDGMGDAKSQIVHQGDQIPPVFSGWQQGKVTYGSGESLKEQSLHHSQFRESSDEIEKIVQQKALEKDDKISGIRRKRMDKSEGSDDEQIAQLSGGNYAMPAVSYGGIESSEDIITSMSQALDDSYQAYKKTENPETSVAASYQLEVPINAGQMGVTGIATEAIQASQLSGRVNHMALPRSGPNAQEGKIPNILEEHDSRHHAGNVHPHLPTVDQRVDGERLAETASNSYLPAAVIEPIVPSSTSEMWWGDMRLERDTKIESSRYVCEPTGNLIDDVSHGQFISTVSSDMSKPQYHHEQFWGKSLIDDDYGHSAYPLSGIVSNAIYLDGLTISSSMDVSVNSEENGIYQKADPLNHDLSKGFFQQSDGDQAGRNQLDESSSLHFPTHLDAMGVALAQVNLHEHVDIENKGVLLHHISPDMTAGLNINFPPSAISDCEWGPVSEDVRVDGKVAEVADEESITIQDSDNDEAKIEDSDKDEPVSDAAIAEAEAIAHGLQIIKNADLEELRELGSGTFGTVYHGKWRGSDVAIKRIKNSCFMGRPSEQERMRADFWREAWMLAHLHHPNVVAFYGVVPDGPGGTLATVTEYMVNGSLKQVLQRKDRSIDRRKRLLIAMDAAFGMEYLHGKDIVHFDLKCENLLVNMRDPQRPICKVGDLGLSKIKHQTLVSGGVRGTLPWMAPELLNGSSSMVSEKVDVFSFGIVMWELLTGEEPYANMHYGAIIGGIVNNTLRPHVPNWCDPTWRSLMEQCWSADPAARPSFTEIANRLRAMAMSFHSKSHGHHPNIHHG